MADAPEQPTTVTDQATIIISWIKPYNGATAITSYTIAIRKSDGVTFAEDLVNCDGTNPTIVASRTCTVPVSVLRNEPFTHEWGSSIWAKVSANNVIGLGPYSAIGNGAIMLTTPDPPINFFNNPDVTNS